ncbi:simple sugar transport system permease protein [Gibbsiella quercinecans]|uniref:Sugar ABC transporter permease n=1 Tax=Gibbsiella quercinecans TaxID=929813 RepID=A0A250B1Q5_9GAMM|nr:ABC transporter permease [Gibbsiella quercinecans]ATA20170.1 sugar ABC transporter permease [Gibbsiella quercinecans]RLM07987.1 sugar ABC transporter permease [Gibbsiella quercinecans]RLM08977.1 sugar ABC transporter permease [Gibbsiella quercinecans]TCT86559.1 simple sugar transport system permease protein [Gibbsiella quercinecans]
MSELAHIDAAFLITWLAAAVRLAGPVLLAALGEIYAERAGVLNIGIEGTILMGALGSYMVAVFSGSTALGFIAGGVAGLVVGVLLAMLYLRAHASQIVVGIVFNILAAGIATWTYSLVMGNASSPTISMLEPLQIPLLSAIPAIGPVLFSQPLPLYITLLLVAVAHYGLFHTRFGLSLRAVGENPRAAHAAGLNVLRIRTWGVLLSCVGAGLAGSYLVTAQIGLFRDNIVSGQGFIALAIVIFGRWSPVKALIAAFVFGAADALQLSLQLFESTLPPQLLLALPYLLTILAMSGVVGRTVQPGALTQPYRKE